MKQIKKATAAYLTNQRNSIVKSTTQINNALRKKSQSKNFISFRPIIIIIVQECANFLLPSRPLSLNQLLFWKRRKKRIALPHSRPPSATLITASRSPRESLADIYRVHKFWIKCVIFFLYFFPDGGYPGHERRGSVGRVQSGRRERRYHRSADRAPSNSRWVFVKCVVNYRESNDV